MERACDLCGELYEAQRSTSRFHAPKCRVAWAKGARPAAELPPPPPPSTKVGDALAVELQQLGVAESYEGVVALGLARQLDNGTITGTAYVSLSKELDRRVESLRLKAERPDDPAKAIKDRLVDKKLRLA